ncbi:MAG: alpha/beta fold hydrolase, partial [Candidatus Limnocylindrales bacterium]
DPADLPLYGTVQAVEDLESIRRYLDVDTLHLYGESYGTQFVQYYAAAYPSHIATLYLDGPVDLTIDGPTYYVEAARSAEDTLTETLDACAEDETCTGDVAGGDLLAAYDALATRLVSGPQAFDWTTADGATVQRQLTIADLQNAAFGYIYSPTDRFLLQRSIAAASHGNLVPLARLSYESIGVDPETLDAIEDPSWSDALYFAVECQDYAFFPTAGDPDARLAAWVDHATAADIGDLRMGVSYFGDVPCLYWPDARPADARPAAIVDPPYPVFVLTSTTDPATPIANGMRIYSRLDDAYFFQALGGPHVIFAWGEPCPDEIVYAYMADGTLPPSRVTSCVWDIADPYIGIAPTTAAGYDGPLALAASVDDQILSTDDYLNRLDTEALVIGCDFGGTLTYTPSDVGTEVVLDACEFTDGLALSGDGATDDEAGTFEIDLERGADRLHYERDAEGGLSVSGTLEGRRVEV